MHKEGFEPLTLRRLSPPVREELSTLTVDPAPTAASTVHLEPGTGQVEAAEEFPTVSTAHPPCEPKACAIAVRDLAIRLAAQACAQALGVAVARNPLFVARFVDAALRAAGRPEASTVRLNPADALACSAAIACDVVADESIERGSVIVDTGDGAVGGALEERALLLVRSAADA